MPHEALLIEFCFPYPEGTNLAHLMGPSGLDPDSSMRRSESMQVVRGGEQINDNLLQALNIPYHKNKPKLVCH